jgi:hypothetical protein
VAARTGLDRDEVAGAHPKSAPDFVLLVEACQARVTKNMNETARSSQLDKPR